MSTTGLTADCGVGAGGGGADARGMAAGAVVALEALGAEIRVVLWLTVRVVAAGLGAAA